MRQVGVLAAAGIVALKNMIDRLAEDHAHATLLAGGLAQIPGIILDTNRVQTNIVIFDLDQSRGSVQQFISQLALEGVKVTYPGERSIRMVTHRHIMSEEVVDVLARVFKVVKEVRAPGRGASSKGNGE